jgi:hypothetical protein
MMEPDEHPQQAKCNYIIIPQEKEKLELIHLRKRALIQLVNGHSAPSRLSFLLLPFCFLQKIYHHELPFTGSHPISTYSAELLCT